MPKTLDEMAQAALSLSPQDRIALAGILLESVDASEDALADTEWEREMQDRIAAVRSGRAVGIPFEEVMRKAIPRDSR